MPPAAWNNGRDTPARNARTRRNTELPRRRPLIEKNRIQRTIGLAGATGVGVGAIVGGGILALAGVAFATTGPGALLAFALNGLIALLTALSFSEMAAAMPESGGTYTFAKKVLNVRIAFGVGWVVWFASLVAAVLYALGFASFVVLSVREIWSAAAGTPAEWLQSPWTATGIAVATTLGFCLTLTRQGGGDGKWINISKLAVFVSVILGGLWTMSRMGGGEIRSQLVPFFPGGATGLFQAMGFTFIALQGFDLIAAVAGEVKDPGRTIPRAMIGSLGIALTIYLPLLLVLSVAGVGPGESIADLGRSQPEAVVAVATRRFLGGFGFWLVTAAGLLSMLSALQANLFAASRVAYAMAQDRTLAPILGRLDPTYGMPRAAIATVGALVTVMLLVVPDLATAGAASSLIFLVTFALAHFIAILFRRRMEGGKLPFRVPWFPVVPIAGGMACAGLAFYQGVSVPAAGVIAVLWLTLGGGLYAFRFGGRAQIFDASAEAVDPLLMKSRGRNPLILLPVDYAPNAPSVVAVAQALSPPGVGRVLLLSIVPEPDRWVEGQPPAALVDMSATQLQAVTSSFSRGLAPEAMMTVAQNSWSEILRVSRLHRCQGILFGMRSILEQAEEPGFNELLSSAPCSVVLLRAPAAWRFQDTRRILVPIGGRGSHSMLRARLLGSLRRQGDPVATYLCLVRKSTSAEERRRILALIRSRAEDEMGGRAEAIVEVCDDPAAEIIRRAQDHDLVILGLQDLKNHRRAIGEFTLRIARETDGALLLIGHRSH